MFFTSKYLLTQKKRGKEKGQWRRKENCEREGVKCYKMLIGRRWKGMKMSRVLFLLVTFLEPLKFVWGLQNGNFYQEKGHCYLAKNQEKWFCPPPEKYSSYASDWLRRKCYCQFVAKICMQLQKDTRHNWNAGIHAEMRYDIKSILEMGSILLFECVLL